MQCSKLEEQLQKWKISRKSLKIKIQRRITQKIRIQTTMNILLVLCTLIVSVMSKTVTIKEYEGHGCEGEPKSTSTYEITMGCTSGNVISSFQSTCDMYSFKLTYEMFLGSTTCEKQCSSSLCYDKTEMYVCLVLVLPLSLSLSRFLSISNAQHVPIRSSNRYSGYCEDFTYNVLGIETYSSQYATFDCYSDSWFFYVLITMGFLLCCCVPCFCGYYCARRRSGR